MHKDNNWQEGVEGGVAFTKFLRPAPYFLKGEGRLRRVIAKKSFSKLRYQFSEVPGMAGVSQAPYTTHADCLGK